MTRRGCLTAALMLSVFWTGADARMQERAPLTLAFPEMAPYLVRNADGQDVSGPVADRIRELARLAGVEIRWVGPMPRPRIWAALEAERPVCHPNARGTPERLERFKMTDPIFEDATFRVVRRSGTNAPRHSTLISMLQDEGLVFGRLLGSSFGPELDAVIDARAFNVASVRGSSATLLKMVHAGRIDFALMAVDELAMEAAAIGAGLDEFDAVILPDLPRGDGGRIVCSRSVPDRVIQAFNDALRRERQAGTVGQEITR